MAPDELAGLHEVAEILGVPKRTAARYVLRDDFPEPLDRLAAGPVWRRVDVAQWGRDHLPLPSGRPAKPGA
jgi:hypothetical protein